MSQQATEAEKAELLERLRDPVWRLCNLYRIVDKAGRDVPFVPTPEQLELITAVYVLGQRRHAILKARQMGFSTLIEIMILDAAYFGENIHASIVDQTQPHATAKLKEKCGHAFAALGPLRDRLEEDNARTMAWANGSRIEAGKNARGGTNQWLHVSEWGPIAHDDPKRSEEIKTGALPTAEQGVIFVETTFKGGKGGHLYELLKTAMQTPDAHRTAKDFRFWFFPWYKDKGYTLEGSPDAVPAETRAYFAQKERELGVRFTPGQMLWYAKTKAEQGIYMFREYPTTVEEAMSAPVEGSLYGDIITRIRAAGQIIPFQWDRSVPVFSCWDLGWADSTSVWLVQLVGHNVHVIWHTKQEGKTAANMATILNATEIPVATHFVPHDAGAKSPGEGKNYRDSMQAAGFMNIVVVPRIPFLTDGINMLRDLLPRCWFNLTHCVDGIASLEAYHTKDTTAGGITTRDPVHDWSSHDSSALRIFAEALTLGLVRTQAAKRMVRDVPRLPDGSMVSPELVSAVRQRPRCGTLALSGHMPL